MRILGFFADNKSRRRSHNGRRTSHTRTPLMEEMEAKTLLSATPMMWITNPVVVETPGQRALMNFTVNLSNPSDTFAFAQFQTVDDTAKSGIDYQATSGYVVFGPGQTTSTFTVTLLGGGTPSSIEQFGVQLSGAYNANVITPQGYGTISYTAAAAPPSVSVANVSVYRGDAGTSSTMTFDVKLNAPQSNPVSVTASTADWVAVAGIDYQAKTEVLTFQPGQTTAQFKVTVYGSTDLQTKFFVVNLSSAVAAISTPTAFGFLNAG
ncbi:MAG TPA: Calx-beta domain-containing protein [Isosphaeraceae bacterium]|nr:Calx-beta domain-containing protein [Isosphaeraceae bacterium]